MSYFEIKHISKSFGKVTALDDVSLSVERGELRAILGGNGSGKSTLSKILGGALVRDNGTIHINGQEYHARSPLDAIRQRVIITSQELSLLPERTLKENLSLIDPPLKWGVFKNRGALHKRAEAALRRVNMEGLLHAKVKDLDDSQRYMVELAKALLYDPEILVVDEITSPLRREEVQLVRDILFQLRDQGCTILFISHRMNEIYDICDSVTVLKNGKVINTYSLNEVDRTHLLIDLTGRDFQADFPQNQQPAEGSAQVILSISDLKLHGFPHSQIALELRKGEILGIAGLQGQGQTALLKTLFGLESSVGITLRGSHFQLHSPIEAVQNGIGYLSGDRVNEGVFLGRTISENVEIVNNTVLRRTPLDTDAILRQHNVKYASAALPIESLSGGNQQKVVISRWTSTQPDILLADDPSKGIDVGARAEMHQIFCSMAARGSAILFVSSDDEELVTMAQKAPDFSVAVMYGGRIVTRLKGSDISVANIVAASMPAS